MERRDRLLALHQTHPDRFDRRFEDVRRRLSWFSRIVLPSSPEARKKMFKIRRKTFLLYRDYLSCGVFELDEHYRKNLRELDSWTSSVLF